MGNLIAAILGVMLNLLMALVSGLFKIFGTVFSWLFGNMNNVSNRNKMKKLQQLLDDIVLCQKKNTQLKDEAFKLMNIVEVSSHEYLELSQLINYCNELDDNLKNDYEVLSNDLKSVSPENFLLIVNKSKAISKRIASIHYPMDENRLREISRNNMSKNRFIETLIKYAKVADVKKKTKDSWTYSTPNANYLLEYDERHQKVSITASPHESVTFIDNPKHPWQYVEPNTLVYFNNQRKLEYKIMRDISEIDHYDVSEIFDYMQRIMHKREFNFYAHKTSLSLREVEELEENVFPELKSFVQTAPPPVEYLPDDQKMHGGKQRWAQLEDLRRAGMLEPGGFLIGKMGYGAFVYTKPNYDSHILTVASVGSGKGVGVVIPNLLRHQGSTVVLDPKGENLITTARKRSQMGNQVFYYDPWDVIGFYDKKFSRRVVPEAIKAQINPLDFLLPNSPDLEDHARMLASSLILRTDQNGAFFYNGAENLIARLIIYICTVIPVGDEDRNMLYLRDLLNLPPKYLLEKILMPSYNDLKTKRQTPHPMFCDLIDWLHTNIASKARSFNDIYSFALQATEFLSSPRVGESLARSNINICELKISPMSLYLVLDMDKILFVGENYKPLVRLIITTCMLGASVKTNAKHKLLFMLDEIAQLGNLQYLPNLMSIYRSKGVVVWTIWQNLEQIRSNYEKDWESMIGNCDVQQYFGVNDQSTAEVVSKAAGNTTVFKETYTTTQGESRGETIAKTFGNSRNVGSSYSKGTSNSYTYQGFNFSSTSGDSMSKSESMGYSDSYSFSRSIQISTSHSEGTSLAKEVVPLITPYEVTTGSSFGVQFVFYKNRCPFPILSGKIKYYEDLEFYGEASENLTRLC
ncbi:type IV secretory system conjugative DNA transfer family protein [Bacteroides sp. An322]|uniref:type IV secretory system conjugative DNA transfer family protein n=1 Tax=Bacteroides sp. An322 TaxID=1965632 RepID=UPI000B378AE8|nr:type IV secretory system conjugative DNA transfer family protein [Bacteroides sp. An322]OUO24064.1 hypothetical protein B5F91_00195 [Bacteroides sp. An322]